MPVCRLEFVHQRSKAIHIRRILLCVNDRYVFINDNGHAKRVSVEMGQRFGDDVEIYGEGIEEGVEVVVKGEARLIDGVKINVVE